MPSAKKRGRPSSQKLAVEIARTVSAWRMVAEAKVITQPLDGRRARVAQLPPPVATKVYDGGIFVATVAPYRRIKVLMKVIYRDVAEKYDVHEDYVRRCYVRHRPAVVKSASDELIQRAAARDEFRERQRRIETQRWLAQHGVRIAPEDGQ